MSNDIGDVVTVGVTTYNDTTGVAEDAASVTATITLPDATTSAVTLTHTVGTGIWSANYTTTMAGLHRVKFVVVGTSTVKGGVSWQQFEVINQPPPADLFTVEELASYLQRDVDTESAKLARDGAQAIVRAYTRQPFTQATYTGVKLPVVASGAYWRVDVPQRPLTAISSVSVNGTSYTLGTNYAWDGVSPYFRIAQLTYTTAAFQDEPVATVTYTAGYTVTPPDVKAVALAIAGRQYDNPRGLRSESIDDYTGTRAGSDEDLAGTSLLPPERKILDRYRVTAGSVVPR